MKLLRYIFLICSFCIYSHVFSEEAPEAPADEAPVVEEAAVEEPAEPVMEEAEEKPAE